ncbi:DUF4145 domain-containing protein [Sphingomonas sp.]|uniref:DUF4145 domain-containing protein n=1 Tax=Sphingomonas sp. TaxID=28214 RepID=UPI0025E754B6|nr:DUF4145 domain-containing protein [Sphingomonas sp.]
MSFKSENNTLPVRFPDAEEFKRSIRVDTPSEEIADGLDEYIDRVASGLPSIGDKHERSSLDLTNVDVSECYNCGKVAIWLGDSIIWPRASEAPPANPDLPEEIAADYYEAGQVLDASPRAAAALLRLALQKLCVFLGEPGENLNTDIGSLVKKGLDPRVQKALDIVRITGNNAVHPGELDLRDNRETAEKLFGFLNLIADIMISQPKAIDAVYGDLPQGALDQIEKRDGKRSPSE